MTALRPVRPEERDRLGRWRHDPVEAGEFQWFGHLPEPADPDRPHPSGEGGSLAVVDDDDVLVGDVQWFPRQHGPVPGTHCWMIGILLLPEHRGHGHGSRAQRELAAYLFEHTTVERVEAGTDAENIAEQRALANAGFTREGVLRRAQWRAGAWHDMVLFAKLRGEP